MQLPITNLSFLLSLRFFKFIYILQHSVQDDSPLSLSYLVAITFSVIFKYSAMMTNCGVLYR
jgi:hypothetical protein